MFFSLRKRRESLLRPEKRLVLTRTSRMNCWLSTNILPSSLFAEARVSKYPFVSLLWRLSRSILASMFILRVWTILSRSSGRSAEPLDESRSARRGVRRAGSDTPRCGLSRSAILRIEGKRRRSLEPRRDFLVVVAEGIASLPGDVPVLEDELALRRRGRGRTPSFRRF